MAERSYIVDDIDENGNPITITMTGAQARENLERTREELKHDVNYSKEYVAKMAPHYARVQSEYDEMVRRRDASYANTSRIIIVLIAIVAGFTLITAIFSPAHKSSASYIARHGY